jgi:hypothetical protein
MNSNGSDASHDASYSAGDAPRLIRTKVVALYDTATGRIKHLHTAHTYEGAEDVTDTDAIARAQRNASALGHDIDKLSTAVSSNAKHASVPHRIDIASGHFVALEIEATRPRRHGEH